jgi:predicted nucleotidyltransferase
MKSLYKIIAERNRRAERFFHNPLLYAKEIKNILQSNFSDIKVIIFGSAVKGDYKPWSDIDILIISALIPDDIFIKAEIKAKIEERFLDAPFELHIVTPQEYEGWYKKFIKDEFVEV